MNVVRHHDIGVKLVVSFPLSIVDSFDYYGCDLRLAKVQRAGAGVIEKPVHGHESLSGAGSRRDTATRREAAVQAPGDEEGLAEGVIVRQAATVESGHEEGESGWEKGKLSGKARRPIDNRPQINNLPHKSAAV
jgi:hypothetical protein